MYLFFFSLEKEENLFLASSGAETSVGLVSEVGGSVSISDIGAEGVVAGALAGSHHEALAIAATGTAWVVVGAAASFEVEEMLGAGAAVKGTG